MQWVDLRALCGRHQTDITQMIDLLLPLLRRFVSRIDVFDIVALAIFDYVGDPAALDFDGRRAVGEKSRTLRAVEMELDEC